MVQPPSRIRRLLIEDLGECQNEDVEQRLGELLSLADTAFTDDAARPLFRVLGDETRYRLARVLSVADEELCVCELEPIVDVSESAVSHALSDLVEAGLVTRRKERNWRYYRSTNVADRIFETADNRMTGDE